MAVPMVMLERWRRASLLVMAVVLESTVGTDCPSWVSVEGRLVVNMAGLVSCRSFDLVLRVVIEHHKVNCGSRRDRAGRLS